MSTELYSLPDGKYVMPIDIFRLTDASLKKRGLSDECVRITIDRGALVQGNDASYRFYKHNPEGQRITQGFEWITSVEQLRSLASCLPYGWRE